jgi:hypothetical protein
VLSVKIRPPNGSETGAHFVIYLATGALEISFEFRNKARKAFMREVRRMKFRLYLTFASLYLEKFLVGLSGLRLRIWNCNDSEAPAEITPTTAVPTCNPIPIPNGTCSSSVS